MTFLPESSVLITYSLACFVLFITPGPDMSLFLAKTMAGGERARIAELEASIADEKSRIRLLDAEVAYLERPRRVSHLAETYLGLKPVDAKREATVEALALVAVTPTPRPKAATP